MYITELVKKIFNFLKKILSGEKVLVLARDKSHWDGQFKRGKWRDSEENGQNLGSVSRFVVERSFSKETTVLDVGCGSGVQGQYLAGVPNVKYFGSDISEEAIIQAKERVPKGTFWVGNMEDGPQSDNKFDVIIFAEVLLYCDYKEVLEVYKKALKDDGFVIISLYQTWRTKYIWKDISGSLQVQNEIYVKDVKRGIGWRVYKCTFKK